MDGVFHRLLLFGLLSSLEVKCYGEESRKVCLGTNNGDSFGDYPERYSEFRDHYSGCVIIEGNLEISYLARTEETFDLSFLDQIEEVTGNVIYTYNKAPVLPLKNLRIIRGRSLFDLQADTPAGRYKYALYVADNRGLQELQLKRLTEISNGHVYIKNNRLLCHIDTIDWKQIFPRRVSSEHFVGENSADCSACDNECKGGCWSAGSDMCQLARRDCSECYELCYGDCQMQCCNRECAGGCTGPGDDQCFACRLFKDEDRCVQRCRPFWIYNPLTQELEEDPEGKFVYRYECVKECPLNMAISKTEGACVANCKDGEEPGPDRVCRKCTGECPKSCSGLVEGEWIHSQNLEGFRDCVVVRGSINIHQGTFTGWQQGGQRALRVEELSVLENVEVITGVLKVDARNPEFTNLHFLRNLKKIQGQQLFKGQFSLKIVITNLTTLCLDSLSEVTAGSIQIQRNPTLCLASSFNWQNLLRTEGQEIFISHNQDPSQCETDGLVCAPECSSDGCMGPERHQCFGCSKFRFEKTCLDECTELDGVPLYAVNDTTCARCHVECKDSCSGPGSHECGSCMNLKHGPECVSRCPAMRYRDFEECRNCSALCLGGCSGPGSHVGSGGCQSCRLYLLDTDGETEIQCLPDSAKNNCSNYKSIRGSGEKKGRPSCQKCAHFSQNRRCVDSCSAHYYDDGNTCLECHPMCLNCTGPTDDDCLSCTHFKLYQDFENRGPATLFNCTNSCPESAPRQIDEDQELICLPDEFVRRHTGRQVAIIVSVLISGCLILGIVAVLILVLRRQLAKTEEKKLRLEAKLTGLVECEPLTPSNTKPDMAVLRLIKESDLKRRNVIGSGAFGTVFKGFWIPENETVKIPVAIKVLQEGHGQNDSLLEEARIMASVEHPCCVRILAVCMTAQMMLVTQLMPLGCLLEYIRKNKENIGSKALLNWCTQIAKGMNYLQEKGIIHRDLAARNVLVQSAHHVKITDFGLAKIVSKEDNLQSSGGKWPVKWLALESIQYQIFTHKSDVWSFGVTVWELCTYGQRPYDGVSARNVVDLLEKGERLPQPSICTIDVYMVMIKCWMLDADSRPSFSELANEFAKMARDPGRFLVVQNDASMQLASHPTTTKDLLKFMSLESSETSDDIISVDDYINNLNRKKSLGFTKLSVKPDDPNSQTAESKTETTPLLRLTIPRRSAALGLSDSGPDSPRYSPDPSSLCQPLAFQRQRADSSKNSEGDGAGPVPTQRPPIVEARTQSPQSRSPAVPQGDSSVYLQPKKMSLTTPAYLELEAESEPDNLTSTPKDTKEAENTVKESLSETGHVQTPLPITVTNPVYFSQSSITS